MTQPNPDEDRIILSPAVRAKVVRIIRRLLQEPEAPPSQSNDPPAQRAA
jgi:hypothetical protein